MCTYGRPTQYHTDPLTAGHNVGYNDELRTWAWVGHRTWWMVQAGRSAVLMGNSFWAEGARWKIKHHELMHYNLIDKYPTPWYIWETGNQFNTMLYFSSSSLFILGSRLYLLRGLFGLLVQRMLVVVTEHFEHYGLTLDVINKRLGYLNGELK